ncbi:MAG: hypothetical protein KDB01_00250 [Planctomycetaceae bacterium]|nr:hypothetical protein [Planctomycetaceae bacterium]
MRIQPWFQAVFGASALMAASAATDLFAQSPTPYPMGAGGPPAYAAPRGNMGPGVPVNYEGMQYGPPPGQYGYGPPPGQYGGAQTPPQYPPGLDPTQMQPWPMVSPYQSANIGVDQTYNKNGLWFREVMYRKTDWTLSVEAIQTWYRDAGDAIIGSPYAPLRADTDQPNGVSPLLGSQFGEFATIPNFIPSIEAFFVADNRVFPIPFLDAGNAEYDDNAILFRPHGGAELVSPDGVWGIKGSAGYTTEDGSGVMFNGWWGNEARQVLHLGRDNYNGVPVTQNLTQRFDGLNLEPLGALPLNNGESPYPEFGPGSTAKFDVLYRAEFSTAASGANVAFYLPTMLQGDSVSVRPLWGARYLYIDEAFAFRGIDSGFTYDLDDEINPTGVPAVADYAQFEARLANRIKTHLAGPEVGVRFDIGNPQGAFHMAAESNFALVVNYEQGVMRGENIGDPLVDINAAFNNLTEPRMLAAGVDTRFEDRADNAHVSPVFHQTISADFDLFGGLPHLKKVHMLEDTRVRLGYTLMYAGKVARPLDSIEWRGFPQFSTISFSHENWWAHQFNAAIDWRF